MPRAGQGGPRALSMPKNDSRRLFPSLPSCGSGLYDDGNVQVPSVAPPTSRRTDGRVAARLRRGGFDVGAGLLVERLLLEKAVECQEGSRRPVKGHYPTSIRRFADGGVGEAEVQRKQRLTAGRRVR